MADLGRPGWWGLKHNQQREKCMREQPTAFHLQKCVVVFEEVGVGSVSQCIIM